MSVLHTPLRPGWECRACRDPWPCHPARVGLRRELDTDRLGVSLYCAAQFASMAQDLGAERADVLYARCFGWMGEP